MNGRHYRGMCDAVRDRTTTRHARLLMAACCRLRAAEFFGPRILLALETAERCADDPPAEALAGAVWGELVTSPRPPLAQGGAEGELARAITGAWRLLDECWSGGHYRNARHAIAHAAYLCPRGRPQVVFTGGEGNAADYRARAIESAESSLLGARPEEAEQGGEAEEEIHRSIANLLRDIFGNPFRPVAVNPAWRTADAALLAWATYEQRELPSGRLDPARLAVLADALEGAGCGQADLLGHPREPGPHVRGCWAVDLLLSLE